MVILSVSVGFILSTKEVNPYFCGIWSNFVSDMTNENMKIMNWKNGLLLSTVSFMLYLILWFILDDETAGQLPEMTVADYIIDYLFCMLFTYISLAEFNLQMQQNSD